ncbi:hypothetical protein [Sphingomonas hengshuiensis]|uniref:Uncharacterized protein n=1 Tax=Sphingomonas hengshuiensis TaxID=1609977 RepID=A0A7U4LEB1_9SPHN|nr:hypothetical protein [Sphingomonas hengshuiensis]AJP71195.1 hypothetical protein TS85_04265 [Sphingomonas hengshuiensis]
MPDPRNLLEDELYDDRNPFVDLLLGLISLSERTLSTVTELAPPLPPAEPGENPAAPQASILR